MRTGADQRGKRMGVRAVIRRRLRRKVGPPFRPDLKAWERERTFIRQLLRQGPVTGGRTWRRADLYER